LDDAKVKAGLRKLEKQEAAGDEPKEKVGGRVAGVIIWVVVVGVVHHGVWVQKSADSWGGGRGLGVWGLG
jgi:hypothetical protein